MKKYLANIITSIRVVLAPFLMFFNEFSLGFLIIFIVCGITDLIDGPIARKTNSVSKMGSVLDSIGDFLLYLGMFKVILFGNIVPLWQIIVFATAMSIHLIAAIYAKLKFKKFYFTHNMLSRLLGVMLFAFPFVVYFFDAALIDMILIIIVATVAGIEALFIVIFSIYPNPDYRYLNQAIKDKKDVKQYE